MEIIINKEDLLNGIKVVEKITAQKGSQPVLSNILIETVSNDRVRFCATDLNLSISHKANAQVEKEGQITLSAKRLGEITSKLDNKPIKLSLNPDTNIVTISCGKAKFELIGISANEFPKVFDEETLEDDEKSFEINKNTLIKGVKQVVFSAALHESASVLSGVCFNIDSNTLEIVATDGNRLTRASKEINSKDDSAIFIVPSRTLQELIRISSIIEDEEVTIRLKKAKIRFEFEDVIFQSKLINGTYPKYHQLIPTSNDKIVYIDRDELIGVIERVCVMVNERTNIIKFTFNKNSLELSTDSPDAGSGKDFIDVDSNFDEIVIAFNYKYVLDSLKNMDTKKVKIEIATSLSATLFKPANENQEGDESYVCLIMPVQVR
ncbi:TPA: DNA polymerase III subunit beta [Candidatus Galligastranaerophilus intestinavium]|uniref:Beta sliding clamp n=1 Tax=Candidatus Galligastranaerophilus intestinavium TaxID=2840836 RepID=A0A9D1JYK4_9BACT|nr:DNA polymerase III subunit beta [Candidatus Galligastranaerophilus intestinavium]